MGSLLPILLSAVVPPLVSEAEKLFPAGGSGEEKHAWVKGLVENIVADLAAKFGIPAWAADLEAKGAELIEEAIDSALDKAGL